MKEMDICILSLLRNDARMSLTTMSRSTGIPVSTLFSRLKSFDGSIISKHCSLIDFSSLGYNTSSKIMLKASKEKREALKKYLIDNPNVNSVFKINNGYDFIIETIFHNMLETEEFLDYIDEKFELIEKKVFFIIDDIKREAFLEDIRLL